MHRLEVLKEVAGFSVVTISKPQSIDFVYGVNNVDEPRARSHSMEQRILSSEFTNGDGDIASSKEGCRSSSLCNDFLESDESWSSLERPTLPRRKKKRSLAAILSEKIRSHSKHGAESPSRKEAELDQSDSDGKETTKSKCPTLVEDTRGKVKETSKKDNKVKQDKTAMEPTLKRKGKKLSTADITVQHEKNTEIAPKENVEEITSDDALEEKKKLEEDHIIKDHVDSLGNLSPPLYSLEDDEQDELEKCSWFHNIDTESATLRLQTLEQEGAFLVRPSSNPARRYPYVLVVYHEGKVVNIPLTHSEEGWTAMGSRNTNRWAFPTVQALIKYCKGNYIGLRPSSGLTGFAILTVTPNKL